MNIRIFLSTILVTLITVAIGQPSKADHKKSREEVKNYVEKNVIPVLKPIRESFDNQLSSTEKQELETVRTALKEARDAHQELDRPARGEKPTEAQMEAIQERRNEHRKLMMRVWTVADNHEAELKQIREDLKPQMETWRQEIQKIMETNRPAHPEGAEFEGKGDHPRKGKRAEGFHHGPQQERMGFHGMTKLTSPTGFLLWDPAKTLEIDSDVADIKTFPNPASSVNTLEFTLTERGPVTVKLLDAKGNTLRTLVDEVREADTYQIQTDLSGLEQGFYFYQIKTESGLSTRKVWVDKAD